jgi:hypothetical protein
MKNGIVIWLRGGHVGWRKRTHKMLARELRLKIDSIEIYPTSTTTDQWMKRAKWTSTPL